MRVPEDRSRGTPPAASYEMEIEPLDPRMTSIQPGGGMCMRLELAWGYLRRGYLRRLRPGYVRKMASLRQGDPAGCPHEVLDPRDLKFFRNRCDGGWSSQDDPFGWRNRLPVVREGLAEVILLGGVCLLLTVLLGFIAWPLAGVPAILGLFVLAFFRNPRRVPPAEPGVLVSPADGVVASIEQVEHDEFIEGPAVVVGIFLSVFNVHINRVPDQVRVIGIRYRPGKFLNALRAVSARENEQVVVRLQGVQAPHRRLEVRQIAGAIARRIVCFAKPGEEFATGESFGMIKFGSRTELVLPREPGMRIEVQVGQKVRAGTTIVARYSDS